MPGDRRAALGAWRSPAGLARVLRDGLPATALLAAGHDWRGALAVAHLGVGEFEVAVIVLARTEPWVGAFVAARRTVVDGIDSLAANLDERGRAAIPPGVVAVAPRGSGGWRASSDRCRCGTTRSSWSPSPRSAGFAGRAVVAGLGVELRPIGETARGFDVGFWGACRTSPTATPRASCSRRSGPSCGGRCRRRRCSSAAWAPPRSCAGATAATA